MNKALLMIAATALATITQPVSAKSEADNDRADINAAYDAIRGKKFETAVSKADAIVARFEAGKQADSIYRCASGQADVLATLLVAAVKTDSGAQNQGKNKTITISDYICSAYFIKGFALVDLRKRDEALPNLLTAVEMDPDNQHYLNEVAEWHKVGRDWKKSLEIFTTASETTDLSILTMQDKKQSTRIINTMRCRSYRGIAFNHAEMRNWDEARTAIGKCLKLIPDDPGSKRELQYIAAQSSKK